MSYPSKRDCEHGRLRGSCETCDYEQEMADLKQERDQLQARVASLEDAATEYVRDSYRPEPKYDAARFDRLVEVLNRTPAQSLAARDARVKVEALTSIAKKWREDSESVDVGRGDLKSAAAALEWEADRLEAESEGAE